MSRAYLVSLMLLTAGCGRPITTDPEGSLSKAERDAIAAIRALGGEVHVIGFEPEKAEVFVVLRGRPIGDADMTHIRRVSHLRSLALDDSSVTDEGLKQLAGLHALKDLYLRNAKVTGRGLEHLRGLTGLRTLELGRTGVTNESLRHLAGLKALETLDVSQTKVTDEGLRHLAGLSKLQSLDLTATDISDKGLEFIQGLSELRTLYLSSAWRGRAITDRGVTLLQNLKNLRFLNLSGAQVTDVGVEQIARLKTLETLYVDRTRIPAGREAVPRRREIQDNVSRMVDRAGLQAAECR